MFYVSLMQLTHSKGEHMKNAFMILAFMFACSTGLAAELLVQAQDSKFETGAKKGDIIVVRPDGWEWGKEECLPNYIVVKLPGVKIEDAKKYEEALFKTVSETRDGRSVEVQKVEKKRKYNIEALKVDQAVSAKTSTVSIDSKDVSSYTSSIKEKVLSDEKEIFTK